MLSRLRKVIPVAIQKAFSLDEIDKHQAVEHDGGIPFVIGAFGDAGDKLEEGSVFLLKPVVETLGDALDIEAGASPAGDIGQRESVFFLQGEGNGFEFLQRASPDCDMV